MTFYNDWYFLGPKSVSMYHGLIIGINKRKTWGELIWSFPKIGLPPNHIKSSDLNGMFHYDASRYCRTPIDGNQHIKNRCIMMYHVLI